MTASGFYRSQTECPEDTDSFVKVGQEGLDEGVACIRNLQAPHPGDVGQGGGPFRPGDCIRDPAQGLTVKETPCAGTHWATVVRWVEDFASCPTSGSDDAVPMFSSRKGLCVRES